MEKLAVRNPEFPMASTDLDVNVVKLVYFVSDANVCNLVEQDALKIANNCLNANIYSCLDA
jgi:hypothetical protein